MTLNEISSWLNRNLRFKLAPAQIPGLIDMCQKMAFDEDLDSFLYWDATLTIYQQLNYASAATDPDDNDIGQTVTGQTSGSTGTLIGYDNTNDYIYIETDDDFTAGEQVTAPTGMDITLDASDHQEGYKGPYDYPTTVPVRKMWGITTLTDAKIFGVDATYLSDLDDYGSPLPDAQTWYNDRRFFVKARTDRLADTITLIQSPNTTDTYRWVYFRYPETITDLDADDAKLLIPDRYHMQFVQLCIRAANVPTEDGKLTRADVTELLYDFWDYLKENYTPMGRYSTEINQGNVP